MKITKVETIRIKERPNLIWIHVYTDEGLIGLGETFFGADFFALDLAATFFAGAFLDAAFLAGAFFAGAFFCVAISLVLFPKIKQRNSTLAQQRCAEAIS